MTKKLEEARTILQLLEDLSRDYNGNKRNMLDLGLDLARIRVSAMERILNLIKQNEPSAPIAHPTGIVAQRAHLRTPPSPG